MSSFLSAVRFLTVIPFGKDPNWGDGGMVLYFPLVGLAIGGLLMGADLLFGLVFDGEIRAVLDILFWAALTGGLHLDGLADTADGCLSHRPRKETLRIMKDERIGVMGALALIFCLLLKVAGLFSLEEGSRWVWLLAAPGFGRTAQVLGLVFMEYARDDGGIASGLFQPGKSLLLVFCPLPLLIPFLAGPVAGVALLLSFLLLVVLLFSYFKNKLGGMTGDTLGAATEITETAVLLLGCVLAGW